ncbi:hypothetical protein GCK72_004228 [Caenorhabditis remanei]|uniref:Uncharacterized protein n=1 Tax=Caenorhabditis remanei TaxID=31234 RepID=A0A6A5HBL3_CAERE|nr:hypothetical protein GCK72_004228 [Caenorhabditis remanei]KAF1764281.1 hypothetical protein GCK72_004228 [Caenorhabditis remanei]
MILFLFWSLLLPLLLATCVSKKSQKSGTTSTRDISEKSEKSTKTRRAGTSHSALPSDKSERALSSEKSVKKERNTAIDSLKVPRHHRPSANSSNSGKSLKTENKASVGSETDSVKTETIEVPLGKAAT